MSGFIIRLEDNGVLDHYWKIVSDIGEGKARKVFAMAMNKVGRKGYTSVVRALSKQTSIKQKDVRAATSFRRASPGSLATIINANGRPLSLKYFGAKQFAFGSRAKVWGKTQRFESAFIYAGTYRSGNPVGGGHVFIRTSAASKPLRTLYGPSVPNEIVKDDAYDAFEGSANEVLTEVTRLLKVKGLL